MDKSQKKAAIADYIKLHLKKKGYTQRDLAWMLNKAEAEITRWLKGNHNFTIESLMDIEQALGIKIFNI